MKRLFESWRAKQLDGLSDAELIERSRAKDARAYRVIYDRYSKRVAARVVRMMGDGAHVDDIVQETFVKAYLALDRFDTSRDFAPWLMAITRNLAISAMRSRKATIDLSAMRNLRSADVWGQLTAREQLVALQDCLTQLNPETCEAFVLHDIEGLTLAEIADMTDTSLNTIAARVRRARTYLKRLMVEEQGLTVLRGGAR